MVTLIIVTILSFAGGFVAGVKNAGSNKVAKAKNLVNEIKR
jgi:hypothetical protein